MKASISIILPFCNSENNLGASIESILSQTFQFFELILVDNNSNDHSYDMAMDYAAQDPRINLVSEPQQRIVPALNTGIKYAKGKYIARMDADNISLPERLEFQYNFLEKNRDTGLVACGVNYIGDKEANYGFLEYVKWNNRIQSHEDIALNRFVESPLMHPTVMFRRELVEKFGGYKEGDFPEDYELWLRFLYGGVIMHKLKENLLDWYDSTTRLTRTDSRYDTLSFFETKTIYLFEWLKENNRFFPNVVVWGAGRRSREQFGLLHDLGVRPKFFIDLNANPSRRVIDYKFTPPAGNNFIVSYVANRNAREKIKEFLIDLGYIEGKDFICVA
jgi:glycosyltransferase involved in cell wall biosynthesis